MTENTKGEAGARRSRKAKPVRDEPCRVLVVAGEKGGTGKSTLATNLAVMLRASGRATLLVDCDRQATAYRFAGRRAGRESATALVAVQLSGDRVDLPLADFATRYQAIVVDCGGRDSVEMRSALVCPAVSRLVLPIQASFFDLETLVAMDALVGKAQAINPGLSAACLLNRCPSNRAITTTEEARTFILEELPSMELLEPVIHERIAFSYAAAGGESVVEYEARTKRNGKAAAEMVAVYQALMGEEYRPAAGA